jgi:hypothetical protein
MFPDWNLSSIIKTQQRYSQDPGSPNNLPSYWFVQGYAHEHHLISYKITSNNVGISESNTPVNGIKLYQNQPNPFHKTSLVNYEITNTGTVTMEVYDMTGRKLMDINEGFKNPGKYSILLNASGLSKGVYFYCLKMNGASITRRMVITE